MAFHTRTNLKLKFGTIDSFIFNGAIVMTAFFIISGFSLHYIYANKSFENRDLGQYYKKRVISILPGYYTAALLYLLRKKHSIADNLFLAPIEALGLQTVFSHESFKLTHNEGTWFISCLILCYMMFPAIEIILKKSSLKIKLFLFFVSIFILLYSPIVIRRFSLETIYSNPFFRGLEFLLGIILADYYIYKSSNNGFTDNKDTILMIALLLELLALVIGVQTVIAKGWIRKQDYMMLSWVSLPVFLIMTLTCANMRLKKSKVVSYLNEIAYPFFLAQLFIWNPLKKIFSIMPNSSNASKILLSFFVCTIMAVVFHEMIEKPVQRLLRRIWIK